MSELQYMIFIEERGFYMLNNISQHGKPLLIKLVICSAMVGAIFPTISYAQDIVTQGATGDHKHHLKILEGPSCWYTPSFRPEVLPDSPLLPVKHPLPDISAPMIPNDFLISGGISMSAEEQGFTAEEVGNLGDPVGIIDDATHTLWKVHGQLTWEVDGVTYAGCAGLISPWHVMTSADNVYDFKKKSWWKNIQFHPGRNGETILLPPVSCVKLAILSDWVQGNKESNMAILELSQDVGNSLGYNGVLCGEDAFLKAVDPINLTGYLVDKPKGTMCTTISSGQEIYDTQISYKLSAGPGMSGANPWAVHLRSLGDDWVGPYSLGVHTYGVKGVTNLATRLTRARLESIVNVINNVF